MACERPRTASEPFYQLVAAGSTPVPNYGPIIKRIKIWIDSEEVEILVRRFNQARKIRKFCNFCRDHFYHEEHQDDDQNSYYLCESCDTPN